VKEGGTKKKPLKIQLWDGLPRLLGTHDLIALVFSLSFLSLSFSLSISILKKKKEKRKKKKI
jgi:hypothetical protein